MSLSEKADLLLGVTATMQSVDGVALASATLTFWDTNKWFVSSQGHRIHQHLVESGGGFDARAIGETETQRRSFPQSFGQYETGGFEVIRKWDYPANAGRIAEEAVMLLTVPEMEEGERRPDTRGLPARPPRFMRASVTPSNWIGSSVGRPPFRGHVPPRVGRAR